MYLSYSGHKTYSSCPRMYWHQYVGKTKLATPENKVNSLYGTVVGTLFESFYRDRLWRETGIEQKLVELAPQHLTAAILRETRTGAVRWKPDDKKANYASEQKLLDDVLTAIPRGLRIIRHHRLLGPTQSEAEVKLDHSVNQHTIGGRADFLIRRVAPHNDLVLLDGKGSKWRGKYVDDRQLRWYAMLHRLKHGFAPDRLGFVFWRCEAENALDWVGFTIEDLLALEAGVLDDMLRIEQHKTATEALQGQQKVLAQQALFPVQPGDKCGLCTFLVICPDGLHFVECPVPLVAAGVDDIGLND